MTDLKTASTTSTKPTRKEILSDECRVSEEKDLQSIRSEPLPSSFIVVLENFVSLHFVTECSKIQETVKQPSTKLLLGI